MKKNIIFSILILMLTVSLSAVESNKEELLKRIQQLESQVKLCNNSKEKKYIVPFGNIENDFYNLENNRKENYDEPQAYKSDVPTWLLQNR